MSTTNTEAPFMTELKATDRCDRCGAQAYVVTDHGKAGELLWCVHHFTENEAALAGRIVLDARKTLTA